MAHLKALGIKWLYTITMLLFFSLFASISIGQSLFISIILVGVTYSIVDIYLLRIYGQLAAIISDFGLTFLLIWLITGAMIGQSTAGVSLSLFVTCLLLICEALFHIYMKERVLQKRLAVIIPFPNLKLQSETSEKIYPDKKNKD